MFTNRDEQTFCHSDRIHVSFIADDGDGVVIVFLVCLHSVFQGEYYVCSYYAHMCVYVHSIRRGYRYTSESICVRKKYRVLYCT